MPPKNNKPSDKASSTQTSNNANGPKVEPADNTNTPTTPPDVPASPPEQSADQSAPPQPPPEEADPVAVLTAQVENLTARLLTAHADIQNLHKRFDRERRETEKYAIAKFAHDTVAVADNFERAISSVPENATADNPVLKALLDGVTMTEREFLNVLERHGVKRVSPQGEIFDPHRHQAVMEENNSDVTSGTILKVFQPGYVMADRVLRPAMVVIAKGGPKAIKQEDADEDEEDEEDEQDSHTDLLDDITPKHDIDNTFD